MAIDPFALPLHGRTRKIGERRIPARPWSPGVKAASCFLGIPLGMGQLRLPQWVAALGVLQITGQLVDGMRILKAVGGVSSGRGRRRRSVSQGAGQQRRTPQADNAFKACRLVHGLCWPAASTLMTCTIQNALNLDPLRSTNLQKSLAHPAKVAKNLGYAVVKDPTTKPQPNRPPNEKLCPNSARRRPRRPSLRRSVFCKESAHWRHLLASLGNSLHVDRGRPAADSPRPRGCWPRL